MLFPAIFVSLVVFAAAVLRGFTGFGFALAAVPLLSLAMVPAKVIPIVVLTQAFVAFSDLRGTARQGNWREISWIAAGLVIGTPIGIWLLTSLPPNWVRLAIGALIAASVALLSAGLRLPARPAAPVAALVGGVAGIANGLAAMPGPPIVAFFLAMPQATARSRASMMVVFAATGLAGLTGLLARSLIERETVILSLVAVPGLLLGSRLGLYLFTRSNAQWHRPIALIVLGVLALTLILRGLVG